MSNETQNHSADFALVVEELTELVRQGDRGACEALIGKHPGFGEELRELVATLTTLACWKTDSLDDISANKVTELHRRLGDYRLIREIGRGGMGIVYEAEQISLDRRVALKVLPMAAFLDDRQLRRFKNEARAAAALQHPNIVSVHGVGCERSVHFYAMELIDGPNLASVIRSIHSSSASPANGNDETSPFATLSTQRNSESPEFYRSVAQIGIKTANALHAAHQEGIIHRDIKPANLLLDRQGEIHIADFGLARFSGGEDLTFTGDQLGTLRYMSPEQVEADPNIDKWTDIYSLGVTLYELLAGEPAFREDGRANLAKAIVEREPRSLLSLDSRIPLDLITIVSKATSKETTDRYSTAKELGDDLDRFLRGRSIKAKPATWTSRVLRYASRNPNVTILLAISALLLGILGVGSTLVAFQFARFNQQEVAQNQKQAARIEQQRQEAYARDMLRVQSLIDNGNLVQAQTTLLNWVPDEPTDDLRGIEWAQCWRLCHPAWILRTMQHGAFSSDVAFSPDGKLVAEANFADGTLVWNWSSVNSPPVTALETDIAGTHRARTISGTNLFAIGNVKAEIEFRDWHSLERIGRKIKLYPVVEKEVHVNTIDADAENKLLVIGTAHDPKPGGERLSLRKIDGKTVLFEQEFDNAVAARFMDSSRLVYGVRGHSELVVMNTSSHEVVRQLPLDGRLGRQLHIDQGRNHVAFTLTRSGNGESARWLEVRDVRDWSKVVYRLGLGTEPIQSSNISWFGRYVAAADVAGNVWIADTKLNQVTRRKLHPGPVTSVTFSPDESALVSTGIEATTHVVDVKRFLTPDDYEFSSNSIFISPTKLCSVISNQKVEFWGLEKGPPGDAHWEFGQRNGTDCFLKFNPHRSLVIAAGFNWPRPEIPHENFAAFWDLSERKKIATVPLPDEMPSAEMPITPDGRHVAIARGNELVVIDMSNFSVSKAIAPSWIYSTAISPDGGTIVVGSHGHIYFLSLRDLLVKSGTVPFDKIRQTLSTITNASERGGWDFPDMKFIPGTNELAVVCDDQRIKVFDSATGKKLRESPTFSDSITFLSVSSDGKRFGLSSMSGYFRILTNPGFNEVAKYITNPGLLSSAFSPNGNLLKMPSGAKPPLVGDPSGKLLSLSRTELMLQSRLLGSENLTALPGVNEAAQGIEARLRKNNNTDWARIIKLLTDTNGDDVVSISELEEGIKSGRKDKDAKGR